MRAYTCRSRGLLVLVLVLLLVVVVVVMVPYPECLARGKARCEPSTWHMHPRRLDLVVMVAMAVVSLPLI